MTETQERVSDERLAQYAGDNCPLYNLDEVPDEWIAEVVSVATELRALRAPAHPHVDDAMVERAWTAFYQHEHKGERIEGMRAALLAALQVKP